MPMKCSCKKVRNADWHDFELSLKDRSFYFKKISLFFHIPFGLGKKRENLQDEVEMREYNIVDPKMILLKDGSMSGQVLIEIEKPRFFDPQIQTFENEKFHSFVSNEFLKYTGTEIHDLKGRLEAKGKTIKNTYLWYTTCKKCKAANGEQTVVIFEI